MEVTPKVLRRDANDRIRKAIDRQSLPENLRIRIHAALPEVMAQDDARLARRLVVDRGIEAGAARERHAKRVEVVGRDVQHRHTRGPCPFRIRLAEDIGLVHPPREVHAGIGVPQCLIIRIRPLLERPHTGSWRGAAPAAAPGASVSPLVLMTRAGAIIMRVKVVSATIAPMPIPSEMTQISVKPRSLASDRSA